MQQSENSGERCKKWRYHTTFSYSSLFSFHPEYFAHSNMIGVTVLQKFCDAVARVIPSRLHRHLKQPLVKPSGGSF